MSVDLSWLPPLLLLEDHGGDWAAYFQAVHAIFARDFEGARPHFRGKRMGLKRHPLIDGMCATFWHMVSEGKGESDRTPDLRRCERIAWPLAILVAADDEAKVVTWEERDPKRGSKILLALPDFSYLVVVDDRGDYVLPWTAYAVEQGHSRRKLEKRYRQAKAIEKAEAASRGGSVTPSTHGG
jgi:hypothetical protein